MTHFDLNTLRNLEIVEIALAIHNIRFDITH